MNNRTLKFWSWSSVFAVLALVLIIEMPGCSDAKLYIPGNEDPSANRLALSGQVCTDDPRTAGLPVRVIFLVDVAAGPLYAEFDPAGLRIQSLDHLLDIHGLNSEFSFSVISFGPNALTLAPPEPIGKEKQEYYTRNSGELTNAAGTLRTARGCIGGICRDYGSALDQVKNTIEGDLADMTAGERLKTQYVTILISAGLQDPLYTVADCADPADGVPDDNSPSLACTEDILKQKVVDLRQSTVDSGAASFTFHTLFLAAEDEEKKNLQTEQILQQMAFVGTGLYEKHGSPDSFTLDHISLRKLSSLFEAKSLLVSNSNVVPSAGEPAADSDGDGLSDDLEAVYGTSPYVKDSDLDGVGDAIEVKLVQDPTTPNEKPAVCEDLEGPPYLDLDSDHLNDCEEFLLGTEYSIPDTDGDAVPDWIELVMGTDYLIPDSLMDDDKDGVPNGDESRAHTDPRSSDLSAHLGSSYRYDIVDDGYVISPEVNTPIKITGVTILDVGEDTSPGKGSLQYSPTPVPTLSWKDPLDKNVGEMVRITESGEYHISSGSYDPATGPERWLLVNVEYDQLPPEVEEEPLQVLHSERHCLTFTLRNIALVETISSVDEGGRNDVFVYFSQAPKGQLSQPGLYRVAHIPVIFHENSGRIPRSAIVQVDDEDFIPIGY